METSLLALWWGLLSSYTRSPHYKAPAQPNIVLIMADDLGWNDVGWNNPAIYSPNLDHLARDGVILNSSYVLPTCSPSRAALLTGRYPFKLGLQHGVLQKTKPHGLPLNVTLLPEKLKELGYSTHVIGKWHLGFCRWEYTPTFRGFDSFFGFYSGSEDYYKHKTSDIRGHDFRLNTKVFMDKDKRYSTFEYSQRAVKIIKSHARKKPLFLYLPFQSVHSPLQVPKKYEDMYRDIVDENRRLVSGMVTAMDAAIGSIVAALKQRKMIQNTLIIFLSDNGGSPFFGGNNWPLRGGKATMWEGGTRVPSFVWGKMLKKRGYVNNELIHAVDWFPTLLNVAGGKADHSIDGVNQWLTISKEHPSRRKEFVYGLNQLTGKAAIRFSQFKLIEGSPGHYRDWYPPPNKGVLKLRINKYKMLERHINTTMLFNIHDDPTESNDISGQYPEIVNELRKKLRVYRQQEVPPFNPRRNRYSNPKFWGGVWSPGWC